MSRDAQIAPRRAWWKSLPPAGILCVALALALIGALISVARSPRDLIVLLGAAALALAVVAAVIAQQRETTASVLVEVAHDITPDRARKMLVGSLSQVEGVRESGAAQCRIVQLKVTATVFAVEFAIDPEADAAQVRSRVLNRIWYTRQRNGTQRSNEPAVALQALDATPLFVSLPGDIKEHMAADAEIEHWDAGEQVVQQDTVGDSCFIVRHGRLGVYVSNDRAEVRVATLEDGDLFGEMSLLTGERRWATVRSDENTELVRIRTSALKAALKRSPELVQSLAETAAMRRAAVSEARAALDAGSDVPLQEAIRSFMRVPGD